MNLKPFRVPLRFWKGKILSSLILSFCLVGASPLCAQTAGFAYVVNNSAAGMGSVSAYTINATTGALTPIAGSPFAAGSDPTFVAVSPNGRFAYVTIISDAGIGSVSAYTIDKTTGALTPVPGSPFATAGLAPTAVAVSPNGEFAFVANDFSGDISAYTINATTGALTPVPGSPFAAAGPVPHSVALSPNGQFAYVTTDAVSAYTISATTGALTPVPGSPFAAGLAPTSVAVSPNGRFAYVTNSDFTANDVSAYTIDGTTGALTPVPGSPSQRGRGRSQ